MTGATTGAAASTAMNTAITTATNTATGGSGTMTRRCTVAAALLSLFAAAGCAGPPPPPAPPTLVEVLVRAGPNINAGPDGVPAPVMLRIYQLGSATAFAGAGFFPLFNDDAGSLKTDLVKRDDLLLSPGGTARLALKPEDRVQAVGVFAAFRDDQHATWRAVTAIPAHQSSVLSVAVGPEGVTAAIRPQSTVKPDGTGS